jgi:hypothetical protein
MGYSTYKKQTAKLEVTDADGVAKGIIESAMAGELDIDEATATCEECDLGTWDELVPTIIKRYRQFQKMNKEPGPAITDYLDALKNSNDSLRILLAAIEENDGIVEEMDSIPMPPPGIMLDEAKSSGVRVWLDEFAAWVRHWYPFVHPLYAEAAGVWALSALTARRLVLKDMGKRIYPMLYVMLFAESSVGKTTSAEMAQLLIESLGLNELIVTGQVTPQAFVAESSGKILPKDNYDDITPSDEEALMRRLRYAGVRAQVRDEFGQELANMYSPNGVYKENKRILLQWYGGGAKDGYSSQSNGSNGVSNPYMPMLGCGTFDNVSDVLNKGCYKDGLMQRFATLGLPEQPYVRHPRVRGEVFVPSSVLQPAHDFVARLGEPEIHIEGETTKKGSTKYYAVVDRFPEHAVSITDEARNLHDNYEDFLLRCAGDKLIHKDLIPCYRRMGDRNLRVAILIAWIGNGGDIDVRVMNAAMHISERWRKASHVFYDEVTKSSFTPDKSVEDKVIRLLERQKNTENPVWLPISTIANRTRTDIGKVQRILDSLLSAGVLETPVESVKRKETLLYALEGTPVPIAKKQGRPRKKVDVEILPE